MTSRLVVVSVGLLACCTALATADGGPRAKEKEGWIEKVVAGQVGLYKDRLIAMHRHPIGHWTDHQLDFSEARRTTTSVNDDGSSVTWRFNLSRPPGPACHSVELEVEIGAANLPRGHSVKLGDCNYFDLNGDGIIDCKSTTWPRHAQHILFDDRYIPVRMRLGNFHRPANGEPTAIGEDDTRYAFRFGRWVKE